MWNAQSHQIWQKSRPVAFNLASDTHGGERIAYQEPKVLSFTYQLLDSKNQVVGTGRTELAETVSFAEPSNSPPHREFAPETQLVLNWSKGLRQYRS
jgi:hypothetical protein